MRLICRSLSRIGPWSPITSSTLTSEGSLAASSLETGACASHQRLCLGETGRLIEGWARTGRSRLGSAARLDRAQAAGGCYVARVQLTLPRRGWEDCGPG